MKSGEEMKCNKFSDKRHDSAADLNLNRSSATDYLQAIMPLINGLMDSPLESSDVTIDNLFKFVGENYGFDRVFLYKHDYVNKMTYSKRVWYASKTPEAALLAESTQILPLEVFGDVLQVLEEGKKGRVFIVEELADGLPLKKILLKNDVYSFLLAPLVSQGSMIGFVGCEVLATSKTFSSADLILMDNLALLFANLFMQQAGKEALDRERKRLSNVLNAINAGTWEWNVQTGRTFYDDKYAQILGYTLEEMSDTSYARWENLAHPDDIEKSNVSYEKHFRGETQYYECEYRMRHKKGHWIWVYDQGRIITRTPEGKPLQVFGILMDITERKKTEKELQETRKMLEMIIDNIPQGVFWKDCDSVYQGCNRYHAETAGLKSTEEIIGKTDYDLIWSEEETEQYRSSDQRVVKFGRAEYHITQTMHRPGGQVFWYDMNKIPLLNEEGKIVGLLGTYEDITERKKTQDALLRSEARNHALLDAVPDLMLRYSREGELLDTWVNDTRQLHPKTKRYYEAKELKGVFLKDIFPKATCEIIIEAIRAALDRGELTIAEYQYESFGEMKYKEARIVASGTDEVISIVRDITERKKHEAELRYLSFHDRLTALYNRHYLETNMERLDESRLLPISIIMADLNGLKLVNDTYGHALGDLMLRRAADVFRKVCRREDVISRWGGDEFVILLPCTTVQKALLICKRITKECQNIFIRDIPLSVAMGVSSKEGPGKNLLEILREAENAMYKQKLVEGRSNKNAVLQALLKTLAEKSFETETHTLGMIDMALDMGRTIGLSDAELNQLTLVIILHDIGKINIAEEILTKSGPLTDSEWEIIKRHPEIGFRIARTMEDFSHVATEILHHHERWDGKGYPAGLKGEEIPLLSRITAIADAYEVMSNGRPYKKAMSREEIIAEFKRCSGTQFDPQLVEVILSLL